MEPWGLRVPLQVLFRVWVPLGFSVVRKWGWSMACTRGSREGMHLGFRAEGLAPGV